MPVGFEHGDRLGHARDLIAATNARALARRARDRRDDDDAPTARLDLNADAAELAGQLLFKLLVILSLEKF